MMRYYRYRKEVGMISFMLLPIIIIVALVFVLAIAVLVSKQNSKGEGDVIKKVYVYLVLFATLMMTIGGGVNVFMNLADIIAPQSYYQSFEEYKMYPAKEGTEATKSEEVLRMDYERLVNDYKAKEINRAKNSIIKSLGWIIIPLPIFIYFQRKLNREQ